MKANTGQEPAFPAMDMNSHMGVDRMELRYVGLTKREYFAAMAMQGMFANPDATKKTIEMRSDPISVFPKQAVIAADELLKALES